MSEPIDITKLSLLELKGLLWDTFSTLEQVKKNFEVLLAELKKRGEEDAKG